jgi:hypothetical protein
MSSQQQEHEASEDEQKPLETELSVIQSTFTSPSNVNNSMKDDPTSTISYDVQSLKATVTSSYVPSISNEPLVKPTSYYDIHFNDPKFSPGKKFPSNYIKTTKYTFLTFLPLNLLHQVSQRTDVGWKKKFMREWGIILRVLFFFYIQ